MVAGLLTDAIQLVHDELIINLIFYRFLDFLRYALHVRVGRLVLSLHALISVNVSCIGLRCGAS